MEREENFGTNFMNNNMGKMFFVFFFLLLTDFNTFFTAFISSWMFMSKNEMSKSKLAIYVDNINVDTLAFNVDIFGPLLST